MSDRDWREWAYLNAEHWPECIPWTGPKREHGPYPWGNADHDHLADVDPYHWTHPDAMSISDHHWGDVCPWCGVPLRYDERVVRAKDRERGLLHHLSPNDGPVPVFHPECWDERERERVESDDHQQQLPGVA